VAALIREGKTHQLQSCMQTGGKLGMRLLNDSLLELVQKGLVDPAEAYSKSVEKEAFALQLAHVGVKLDLAQPGEGVEGGGHEPSAPLPNSTSSSGQPTPMASARPAPPPSPSYSSPSSSAFPGAAPTPPLPKKPAVSDPALEEFRKKRGY
jgi:hypothetical protein